MFDDHFGLTKAGLDGLKNMTRRLEKCLQDINEDSKSPFVDYEFDEYNAKSNTILAKRYWRGHFNSCCELHPHFKVGEVVAVAQSYKDAGLEDKYVIRQEIKGYSWMDIDANCTSGWGNKMFVKADLMPHQIRITSVRIERLQDISNDDCLREGIYKQDPRPGVHALYAFETCTDQYGSTLAKRWYVSPREAFAALIDKVSGKGTWDSNPWVFVYEFELVK